MGYPLATTVGFATAMRSVDVSRDGLQALRARTVTYAIVLVANAEQVIAVPTFTIQTTNQTGDTAQGTSTAQASKVIFAGSGGDFWTNYDITIAAAPPSANITDGTAPECNPTVRNIQDVTNIHLMAAQNMTLSMTFFQG